MSHKDITSKYILKHIVLDVAQYLLDMKLDNAEYLETQTQRVEERRADLVVKAIQKDKEFILHIEIQSDNQSHMAVRMLRYYTDIALSWPGYDVLQYLIYIGKKPLNMVSGIDRENHQYQYRTIDMHHIDCSVFLEQNHPEAIVLAILCDFKNKDKRQVIRKILNRIAVLTSNNEARYRDCILMLEVLSKNRDLTELLKEEEKMLSTIKLEDLPSYEIGIEIGIEKGIEKGIRGGSHAMLLRLLKTKFEIVPVTYSDRIVTASNEQLLKWSEKTLFASNIDDVFREKE